MHWPYCTMHDDGRSICRGNSACVLAVHAHVTRVLGFVRTAASHTYSLYNSRCRRSICRDLIAPLYYLTVPLSSLCRAVSSLAESLGRPMPSLAEDAFTRMGAEGEGSVARYAIRAQYVGPTNTCITRVIGFWTNQYVTSTCSAVCCSLLFCCIFTRMGAEGEGIWIWGVWRAP
jgi:hypothetical protein